MAGTYITPKRGFSQNWRIEEWIFLMDADNSLYVGGLVFRRGTPLPVFKLGRGWQNADVCQRKQGNVAVLYMHLTEL